MAKHFWKILRVFTGKSLGLDLCFPFSFFITGKNLKKETRFLTTQTFMNLFEFHPDAFDQNK